MAMEVVMGMEICALHEDLYWLIVEICIVDLYQLPGMIEFVTIELPESVVSGSKGLFSMHGVRTRPVQKVINFYLNPNCSVC